MIYLMTNKVKHDIKWTEPNFFKENFAISSGKNVEVEIVPLTPPHQEHQELKQEKRKNVRFKELNKNILYIFEFKCKKWFGMEKKVQTSLKTLEIYRFLFRIRLLFFGFLNNNATYLKFTKNFSSFPTIFLYFSDRKKKFKNIQTRCKM